MEKVRVCTRHPRCCCLDRGCGRGDQAGRGQGQFQPSRPLRWPNSVMGKVTAGGQPSFPGYGICTATSAPGCINFGISAGGTYALGDALIGVPKQAPASPENMSVAIGGGRYTATLYNPSNNLLRPSPNGN